MVEGVDEEGMEKEVQPLDILLSTFRDGSLTENGGSLGCFNISLLLRLACSPSIGLCLAKAAFSSVSGVRYIPRLCGGHVLAFAPRHDIVSIQFDTTHHCSFLENLTN